MHQEGYIYIGHGSGSMYCSNESLLNNQCITAISFLMGCSSVRMGVMHQYTHIDSVLYYCLNKAPAVVGCLWDVSDGDLDRITKSLLQQLKDASSERSLVELVRKAKEASLLRSIVGDSVVVYGLPIQLRI